jgi:hypothetical protein
LPCLDYILSIEGQHAKLRILTTIQPSTGVSYSGGLEAAEDHKGLDGRDSRAVQFNIKPDLGSFPEEVG